ncbi:hypothetical protein FRC09_000016 [Ceratobasidium sp. 395]|nr:hypothetical protein FRC09_000016 [Ceratobasidium sp. 395]
MEELRHPQLGRKGLECVLCGTSNLTSSKALAHQDTNKHVQNLRQHSGRAEWARDSDVEAETTSNEPDLRTWDELLDDQEYYSTIPGPRLPDDPPDAIYDDYGGRLTHLGNARPLEDPPIPESSAHDQAAPERPALTDDPFELAYRLRASQAASANIPAPHILSAPSKPEDWVPWDGKSECLMTSLSAFPRAIFSASEIQILEWFTEKLGVPGVSTLEELRACRKRIADAFGSNPEEKTSELGNIFSHNSLKTIIAHEIANPLTREKLVVFPEDAGPFMSNATHGSKWREEVDGSLASPMARVYTKNKESYQDYFVNEPALARLDGKDVPVLVTRWLTRNKTLVANTHRLIPLSDRDGYAIDGQDCLEVPEEDFLLALPTFRVVHSQYNLPHPDKVLAMWPNGEPSSEVPWAETSENPWRARAGGKEVIAVPILGYCDDTSGNMSKKWNKHNSYLFVLAGLPKEDIHSPFHVHFLATSNIASPLEMLEAISRESKLAEREGVWAYDAVKRDMVLAIVWWLALEGDNPMQSELASHVGMNGKHFCRVCHVCGKDRSKDYKPDVASETSRLTEFASIGVPRQQKETEDTLNSQVDEILQKRFTAADELTTDTGIKDKYLSHFLELLASMREQLPEQLYNPALYLPNVTQDTPVEILHVVLLGVTKYFWRDAVSRLGSAQRATLTARLNSVDIRGLGISRIRGKTLVQYAKSLVGSDFRIILQVAPAVLYNLLEPQIYSMWTALCQLAPLVFQPEIHNLEAYLHELEVRIDRLLLATVICNPQWFNKPKFHVLLHLPGHVRRIGPPILFATETFEGYNFVIRLRSVHSNRQAPSADIAASFSLMHAIRHLVSGGYFKSLDSASASDGEASWIQAGPEVLRLCQDEVFLRHMVEGTRSNAIVAWQNTQAADIYGTRLVGNYLRCKSVRLQDSTSAELGAFILVLQPQAASIRLTSDSDLSLARITEILANPTTLQIVSVVAQPYLLGEAKAPYYFPSILVSDRPAMIIDIMSIAAVVLVFHNCAAHGCTVTATRQLRQERQLLDSFEDEVQHTIEPSDLILNVAQLHSAEMISHIYPDVLPVYPGLDDAISKGLVRQQELEQKREAEKVEKEAQDQKRKEKKEAKKQKKEGPKEKRRRKEKKGEQKEKEERAAKRAKKS